MLNINNVKNCNWKEWPLKRTLTLKPKNSEKRLLCVTECRCDMRYPKLPPNHWWAVKRSLMMILSGDGAKSILSYYIFIVPEGQKSLWFMVLTAKQQLIICSSMPIKCTRNGNMRSMQISWSRITLLLFQDSPFGDSYFR